MVSIVSSPHGVSTSPSWRDRATTAPELSQSVPDSVASAGSAPQLTARQRQVLHLVAAGTTSNKDLAKELFISEKTVKSHIERIAASLDVSRRTQLPLRAVELGLLPVPDQPPGRTQPTRPVTAMVGSRRTG